MSSPKKHDSGASEGARRATEDAPESSAAAGGGRWSSKRKVSVILELLRGADLESTSRKYRVTAATLSEWRDRFLASAETGLKSREVDIEDDTGAVRETYRYALPWELHFFSDALRS